MIRVVERLIGRRLMWKIGRRLYHAARRDGSLDMHSNGEEMLQRAFARQSAETSRQLTIVDVGAHLGEWTLSMMHALDAVDAPAARLIAFEPVPSTRSQLEQNLPGGTRHDVAVRPEAVSDTAGWQSIVCQGGFSGADHLATEFCGVPGTEIKVEVVRLDRALAGQEIDLLKIDAEGFDPAVIRGSEELLASKLVGVIQFEYSSMFIRTRSYLFDIFEIAVRSGYKVGLLTERGIEVFDEWHFDLERFISSAMVIVRPDMLDWLPAGRAFYLGDNTRCVLPYETRA